MERLQNACTEFGCRPKNIERDLYKTLQEVESDTKSNIVDNRYYRFLVRYLTDNDFIGKGMTREDLKEKGHIALKRGWVSPEIKRMIKDRRRSVILNFVMLFFSALAALAGVLALFTKSHI